MPDRRSARRLAGVLALLLAATARADSVARFDDVKPETARPPPDTGPPKPAAPSPAEPRRPTVPGPRAAAPASSPRRSPVASGTQHLADRGERLEAEGRLAEALSAYTEAVRLDARNGRALLALGRLRLHLGDAREAERLFTEATEVDGVAAQAHVARAHLRRDRGRFDEVAPDLERAAELLPRDRARIEELAAWHVARRAWLPALSAWRRARAQPDSPELAAAARVPVAALSALAGDLDPVTAGTWRGRPWTRRALAGLARQLH